MDSAISEVAGALNIAFQKIATDFDPLEGVVFTIF